VTGRVTRVRLPAQDVAAQARARGATVGVAEYTGDRRALLAAFGRALRFPGWYGRNLDALHDSLTDLSWLPPGEVVLVWTGEQAMRRVDPRGHRAVLDTLASAVEAAASGQRPLTVVLTEPPPAP